MDTKRLHRIVLDISPLTTVFDSVLSSKMSAADAVVMSHEIELSDYVFNVIDALLTCMVSKDMTPYKTKSQAMIDKLMYDLNKPTLSYQSVYDVFATIESYALRTLVHAVPDIDGEGIFIDSLQRLNSNTVSINLLKCW